MGISLVTNENTIAECDKLKHSVSEISEFLSKSVHFLNSYTILQAQSKISSLFEEIDATQAKLAPRKKFAFSKKIGKKEAQTEAVVQVKEISIFLEGIQDQANAEITKLDSELKDLNCYQLKNLENCRIYLLGRLKAIHMFNLKNCQVYVGPVSGAAHITECVECVIHVAAHQIRIHQSRNTDFYIFVSSNPIVESVESVRFAPYAFKYDLLDEHFALTGYGSENKWDLVQDFKWLKQTKSPNWSVIEENQRVFKTL